MTEHTEKGKCPRSQWQTITEIQIFAYIVFKNKLVNGWFQKHAQKHIQFIVICSKAPHSSFRKKVSRAKYKIAIKWNSEMALKILIHHNQHE